MQTNSNISIADLIQTLILKNNQLATNRMILFEINNISFILYQIFILN